MNKYFDQKNNRLVFTSEGASPEYWDGQWDVANYKKSIEEGLKNRLIVKNTLRYIKPVKSNRVLEAGCGNGQFVYAFDQLGYDSYGVDYAQKTIARTKSIFPNLKISFQDVRALTFPDNYFDAYWSVGVIEHFYDGYDSILMEIKRVLKTGGYLFITFPHMSLLRRIKTTLGLYPTFNPEIIIHEQFYQFALDHNRVIAKLKKSGFTLKKKTLYGGTKGLKDELSFLRAPLQKIYDSRFTTFSHGLSFSTSWFSSHAILLIFHKR